jgi:hypothetical protein
MTQPVSKHFLRMIELYINANINTFEIHALYQENEKITVPWVDENGGRTRALIAPGKAQCLVISNHFCRLLDAPPEFRMASSESRRKARFVQRILSSPNMNFDFIDSRPFRWVSFLSSVKNLHCSSQKALFSAASILTSERYDQLTIPGPLPISQYRHILQRLYSKSRVAI